MLLLPSLRKSTNARIVNVSSALYSTGKIHFDNINLNDGAYEPTKAYAQSKLAQIVFTSEMARRLGQPSTVKCYALHPGIIKTELTRHNRLNDTFQNIFFLSPELGCQTTLYCAIDESLENESGYYYE